jgi:hypothetical protein
MFEVINYLHRAKVFKSGFIVLSIQLKDEFNLKNEIYTDFVLEKRMTPSLKILEHAACIPNL